MWSYHPVMSAAEKIRLEALALPRDVRKAVVAELIDSLDEDDAIDTEWQEEIRRRLAAVRSGRSMGVTADLVHERIRQTLVRR